MGRVHTEFAEDVFAVGGDGVDTGSRISVKKKKYRKHSLVPDIIRTFATAEVAKDEMPG